MGAPVAAWLYFSGLCGLGLDGKPCGGRGYGQGNEGVMAMMDWQGGGGGWGRSKPCTEIARRPHQGYNKKV